MSNDLSSSVKRAYLSNPKLISEDYFVDCDNFFVCGLRYIISACTYAEDTERRLTIQFTPKKISFGLKKRKRKARGERKHPLPRAFCFIAD
jgi:hypothetical protein